MLTSLKYFHELTLPDGSHSQLNKKNGNNSHILNGNHNNNIDGANQNNGHARIHSNHNNNHNSSHNNSHNNTRK